MTTIKLVTASVTRPTGNTTPYTSGDIIANSGTAGSVTPMTFVIPDFGHGAILRRCGLRKNGTTISNTLFRLHLYSTASIIFANGDNGVWSTDQAANYLGAFDITVDRAFTDGAAGSGVPVTGSEISVQQNVVYGVLEARGGFTPVSGEVYTLQLEALVD